MGELPLLLVEAVVQRPGSAVEDEPSRGELAQDGLGMLEVGDGRGPVAVDLEDRRRDGGRRLPTGRCGALASRYPGMNSIPSHRKM